MRNFSIAPISKIKSHFVTIDTRVLYFLSKDFHNVTNADDFRAKEFRYWHSLFHIKRYGKRDRFTRLVETDGVSLCIHYKRPIVETPLKRNPVEIPTTTRKLLVIDRDQIPTRRIAIDPGRMTLLECVEQSPNGSLRRYHLSKKQYYEESHMNKSKKKHKRWKQAIQHAVRALSDTPSRTPVLEEFLLYVQTVNQHRVVLWTHLTQKKRARNRMDVYIHKNKCVDKFFQSFHQENEDKPVIAYGAAKFNPTGHGEIPGPTTFLAKRCAQFYETEMIDEYNTSKMCCNCGCELTKFYGKPKKKQKRKKKEEARKSDSGRLRLRFYKHLHSQKFLCHSRGGKGLFEIRGLRWCSSTTCRKLKSRDVNAALNILKIATSLVRPTTLCRQGH